MMMKRYVISAVHPAWRREKHSPFASFTITYSDRRMAHEKCLWLKAQGFHNVTITELLESEKDKFTAYVL